MSDGIRTPGIAAFVAKFLLIVSALLFLWWWKLQPAYVALVGQTAGIVLRFAAGVRLEGMLVEVDPSGVLSTETILIYLVEGARYPIDIAYLVANIPPYCALVLATPGLGLRRSLRVLGIGTAILAATHVFFLVFAFLIADRVQDAPEIPTAIGLFLMTLPFLLWIVLAYRDKISTFILVAEGASPKKEAPPTSAEPSSQD